MKPRILQYVAKPMCLLLAFCFLTVDVGIRTAQAGMISTDTVLTAQTNDAAREQVMDFLAREEVKQAMANQGVAIDEVAARVATLSDAEIALLANEIEHLPAGASFGAVIGAVVFVFIVLLITDVLGFTKVFPFTKPIR